jgi:beta-galactosidase/beta-glucuronidase
MKDLGFNMLRKHIKIEPDRWYYHCDRLGMLVWQDMVSGGSTYHTWFVTNIPFIMMRTGRIVRDSNYRLLARQEKEG